MFIMLAYNELVSIHLKGHQFYTILRRTEKMVTQISFWVLCFRGGTLVKKEFEKITMTTVNKVKKMHITKKLTLF